MRGLRAPAVLTLALALLLPAPGGATTWTVDIGGTDDFTAIQPALNAAAEGDTVLVLPGTYAGADNRNLSFGTKNLVLRGRDGALATIIDCGNVNGNRGIDFSGGGQDSTCVVDGFTVRNGRLASAPLPGAGIRCEGASPKLINLIIRDNANPTGFGGGLYCNNGTSPIVRNVVFDGNDAQTGGGLYCNMASQPKLRDVTFLENYAVGRGGGAYCGMDCDSWFSDVVFDANTTGGQGAGIACWRSSPALVGCVFADNAADDYGGAIDLQTDCSPFFVNCTLVGNSAPEGGAVHVTQASYPTITQSIVAFTGAGSNTFSCDGTSEPSVNYCVIFANAPGDTPCGQYDHNAFLDPLFCNVVTRDLTLASNSPCLPDHPGNPTDVLVGALGQGCVSSPVRPTTWGRIKCLYR